MSRRRLARHARVAPGGGEAEGAAEGETLGSLSVNPILATVAVKKVMSSPAVTVAPQDDPGLAARATLGCRRECAEIVVAVP